MQLAKILKRYGLTQTDLAAMLGVSPRTVGHWLNGRRAISRPVEILLELIDSGELPQRYWKANR